MCFDRACTAICRCAAARDDDNPACSGRRGSDEELAGAKPGCSLGVVLVRVEET
jgi:hypothetical protein